MPPASRAKTPATAPQKGAGQVAANALANKTAPNVKLDDLADEDRARLLQEASAHLKATGAIQAPSVKSTPRRSLRWRGSAGSRR